MKDELPRFPTPSEMFGPPPPRPQRNDERNYTQNYSPQLAGVPPAPSPRHYRQPQGNQRQPQRPNFENSNYPNYRQNNRPPQTNRPPANRPPQTNNIQDQRPQDQRPDHRPPQDYQRQDYQRPQDQRQDYQRPQEHRQDYRPQEHRQDYRPQEQRQDYQRPDSRRTPPQDQRPENYTHGYSVPRGPAQRNGSQGTLEPRPAPQPPQPPQPPQAPQPPQPPLPPQKHDLRQLFDNVDRVRNGYLTETELGSALVNGDYTRFNPTTVRVMIKMFDRSGDGKLYFSEFSQLWKYLHDWRTIFDRFDTDASEVITHNEFSTALSAFGYTLSPTCVDTVFKSGARLNRQGEHEMSFDMFVKCCISVKSITDTFKRYDTDRDGVITIGFEDFLGDVAKLS